MAANERISQRDYEAVLDDVAALLRLLGLGDHARPSSPHRVVVDEILPAVERLVARAGAADGERSPVPSWLAFETTDRGFRLGTFRDLYGSTCSVQESSLADLEAIWLGCDSGTHHQGECMARMHLSRDQVREFLPVLVHFVETGHLPREKEVAE